MTYSLDFGKKALLIKAKEGLGFAKTAKRLDVCICNPCEMDKEAGTSEESLQASDKLGYGGAQRRYDYVSRCLSI